MASFRIKLNLGHPTGSMNMRDIEGKTITVNRDTWTEVDAISPGIDLVRRWLVIESVAGKSEDAGGDSVEASKKKKPAGRPKRQAK